MLLSHAHTHKHLVQSCSCAHLRHKWHRAHACKSSRGVFLFFLSLCCVVHARPVLRARTRSHTHAGASRALSATGGGGLGRSGPEVSQHACFHTHFSAMTTFLSRCVPSISLRHTFTRPRGARGGAGRKEKKKKRGKNSLDTKHVRLRGARGVYTPSCFHFPQCSGAAFHPPPLPPLNCCRRAAPLFPASHVGLLSLSPHHHMLRR